MLINRRSPMTAMDFEILHSVETFEYRLFPIWLWKKRKKSAGFPHDFHTTYSGSSSDFGAHPLDRLAELCVHAHRIFDLTN